MVRRSIKVQEDHHVVSPSGNNSPAAGILFSSDNHHHLINKYIILLSSPAASSVYAAKHWPNILDIQDKCLIFAALYDMVKSKVQNRVISEGFRPRQFEYHPTEHKILFGTVKGNVATVNLDDGDCPINYLGNYGANSMDAILGLCWMRTAPHLFVSGSSCGKLVCGDIRHASDYTEYERFNKLTSVHVNSTNQWLLTSGYSNHARIYDVETKAIVAELMNAHSNHINISRFSNLSPHLFATSSFDKTAKTWDIRMSTTVPIYELKCNSGIVMINFSPDDTFLLSSALDNEITQFLTVDGRRHSSFDVPKTGWS